MRSAVVALSIALSGGCGGVVLAPPAPATSHETAVEQEIGRVLDDLHEASYRYDEARYIAHFAPDAVTYDLASGERRDLPTFRAFAHAWFEYGISPSYTLLRRTVRPAPDAQIAWFDERLRVADGGTTRMSGILERNGDRWLVRLFYMQVPVSEAHTNDASRVRASRPERIPLQVVALRAQFDRVRGAPRDRYFNGATGDEPVDGFVGMDRAQVGEAFGSPNVCGPQVDVCKTPGDWFYPFFRIPLTMLSGGMNLILLFDDDGSCERAGWIGTE